MFAWRALVLDRLMGLSSADLHFRRSYKSTVSRAQKHGEAVSAHTLFSGEPGLSYSTPALLALVAWWASAPSNRQGAADVQSSARKYLQLVANKIVGEHSFEVNFGHGLVRIKEGLWDLEPWSRVGALGPLPAISPR